MIRMTEYYPRVDDDGNTIEAYRDFQNYLFSRPSGFLWDFPSDKVVIYGTAYRISSLQNINDDMQASCQCDGCAADGSGAGGSYGFAQIIYDRTIHGEGTKDIPLGVKLSETDDNQLWLLEDGLFYGDMNEPYIPPEVTLTGDPTEGEYEGIDSLTLYVHITSGTKPIQSVMIMDNHGNTVHEFTDIPNDPTFTLEYTLPNVLNQNTAFYAVVSDGEEYLSNTLTYTFGDPNISIGEEFPGANNYVGGICIGTGWVIAIPFFAAQFALIDTEKLTVKLFGPKLPEHGTYDKAKFYGAVYIGDGKLVAVPYSATQPLLVDAKKFKETKNVDDITVTPFGAIDNRESKYSGGAYIGVTDTGSHQVLAFESTGYSSIIDVKIDPETQAVTGSVEKIGTVTGTQVNAYRAGVRMGDDCIFVMNPFHRTQFQIIDPLNETITAITGANFTTGGGNFNSSIYIGNKRAIAIPTYADQLSLIDLNNNTVTKLCTTNSSERWHGGVYLTDNKVLLSPQQNQMFAVLTLKNEGTAVTGEIEKIGSLTAAIKEWQYLGAVYAGRGKVVGIACNSPLFAYINLNALKIEHELPMEMTEEDLLSPYFNKHRNMKI